ncbi:Six-hairpin glycosidase superfamily [Arabidopsis thaliana x Arabidopsis arenosa]|nr:Six-hairpin glycosidase superfamily [Arabidopsis thaliana x Arabidopsis arenosa]
MDTPRTAYVVNAPNPASEVAGETTAALSAASIAFRSSDPGYSQTLLQNAVKTFQFADMYRGAYTVPCLWCCQKGICLKPPKYFGIFRPHFYLFIEIIRPQYFVLRFFCLKIFFYTYFCLKPPYTLARHCAYSSNDDIKNDVCPFYCDFNGFQDELLWGAAWLRKATGDERYLNYIESNREPFGASDNVDEFGWDNKVGGLNVLVSKEVIQGNMYNLEAYKASAESFMCSLVPESSGPHVEYTPAGLLYKPGGSQLQHATTISFLLLVYAQYLSRSSLSLNCGTLTIPPDHLRRLAKKQVDYILGDNPMGLSYMVGYGERYPKRIHHRGSSLPSIKDHPEAIRCKDGSVYFNSTEPNPNVLIGAVVGGPGEDDKYDDDRSDFRKSEPTTYINAPFVGVLAYFAANPGSS